MMARPESEKGKAEKTRWPNFAEDESELSRWRGPDSPASEAATERWRRVRSGRTHGRTLLREPVIWVSARQAGKRRMRDRDLLKATQRPWVAEPGFTPEGLEASRTGFRHTGS